MGNWTYLVNGIMQRPDRSQTSLEKIILEKSSNAKRHLPFSQDGAEFFYGAQNCREEFWIWKLLNLRSIFLWVIERRPFFPFIFTFNVFLAFTATLGNTLILIALHKVSSIHPPTKCLFRCLAMSDFCVSVIAQPLFAALLMGIASENMRILKLSLAFFNFFCGFSLATAAAISCNHVTLSLVIIILYQEAPIRIVVLLKTPGSTTFYSGPKEILSAIFSQSCKHVFSSRWYWLFLGHIRYIGCMNW